MLSPESRKKVDIGKLSLLLVTDVLILGRFCMFVHSFLVRKKSHSKK